ncbi:hypothetical protein [Tenacibaculum sp. SDUM215027]|uniref:hypothetical protein n=1 Tax=Tenacibaculum sp. SDUM215027 TaxID=3422596 RepID=UPI003D319F04
MRYFLMFFILFLFANCSSVPKEYLVNDDVCYYNDPIFKISKEELSLDKEFLFLLKKDTIMINNKSFKSEFRYSKDEYITNKQINK